MLKVGVELPGDFDSAGEWLADARAMEEAGAAALFVGPGGADRQALLGALAAVTWRAQLAASDASDTVARLARGRLVAEDAERWHEVPTPENRADWIRLHAAAEEAGADGVRVRLCPPLLDLLRNPDVEEDRSDLNLAQG